VIDLKNFDKFKDTIEWITRDEMKILLPKVMIKLSNNINTQPKISTYIKKNSRNEEVPYAIGELQFANLIILFIVPFTKDYKESIGFEDNELLQRIFIFLKFNENANYIDLSDSKERKLAMNLKLNLGK
jgi:hypothetical protein